MQHIFTNIYEQKIWGDNENQEYSGSSGGGSDISYNSKYIAFLNYFIQEKEIQTVVDLGCGDFRCGPNIYDDLDIQYTGYDTYKKIINYNSKLNEKPKYTFYHLDFSNEKEKIANGDLCILKDVLQHWSLQNIYDFLDFLTEKKKFKYILIINCCNQKEDNTDIQDGDARPLSCEFLPLKKYNPQKIMNYQTKEISMITLIDGNTRSI